MPSVSLRYLNWWKAFKSNCANVIKEYPNLISSKKSALPLIQAKTNKGQCHGSLAPISMKKPKMLSSRSHTHMSRRILNWSDDETVLWVLLKMCLGFWLFLLPKTTFAFAKEFCSWKSFGLVGQLRVWACVGYCFWVQLPVIFQIFGYVFHVLHVQDLSKSVLIRLGFCFLHILC